MFITVFSTVYSNCVCQLLGHIKRRRHQQNGLFKNWFFCHQWSLLDWMIKANFGVLGPHHALGVPILGFWGPEWSKISNLHTGLVLTMRCIVFDLVVVVEMSKFWSMGPKNIQNDFLAKIPKCHKIPKCLHFGSVSCIRIFFLMLITLEPEVLHRWDTS